MFRAMKVKWALAACVVWGVASPVFGESTFTWAPAWRIRHEYWKNWKDADSHQLDNRNYFRIRTSLWGRWDKDDAFTFYVRAINEARPYVYYAPSSSKPTGKTDKGYHFDINEFILDQLYADVRNVFGAPVDVRAGRQDLSGIYGENFVIADGTPADGSRTFYFNAVKASLRAGETNTFDIIYAMDPRDDTYLPVLNEDKAPTALTTTAETGLILDWRSTDIPAAPFEAYYIYKTEDDDGGTGYQAQKGKIHTLGCFAKWIAAPWTLRAQLAAQVGSYGLERREASGGYVYVDRDFKNTKGTPRLSLGFIHLSGDDRSTPENEAWDPVFSRTPWISDLYGLAMSAETGITYYWTNLEAVRFEASVKPTEKLKFSLWENLLWAGEETASDSVLSGDGRFRGNLVQGRVDYAFSKSVTVYLLAEYLSPGDYYKDDDGAFFGRTEVQIKF